jgi:hypothetical protein
METPPSVPATAVRTWETRAEAGVVGGVVVVVAAASAAAAAGCGVVVVLLVVVVTGRVRARLRRRCG